MRLQNIAIIHFLLLLYIVISTIVVFQSSPSEHIVFYTQVLLFITFFWTLYAQIRLNGIIHLFTIFLGLFFLFLLGLPFLDLINVIDITKVHLFKPIVLSNEIFTKVYTFSTTFIAITFLGVMFGYSNDNNPKGNIEIKYSSILFSAGIVIFLLALPGILIKYYLQFQIILQQGYVSIYNGSLEQINYPLICTGSGTLLIIGYCIFISSNPNKKQYIAITTIFLITQIINGLKGQRSVLMFPFVCCVWFYLKFYIGYVSKRKIILMILCVAVAGQAILFLRHHNDFSTKNNSFVEKYISGFFIQQGVSFFILPYMLHYDLRNDRYPYLIAPLDIRSYGKIQNTDRLKKFNYLPDQLMYRMLPQDFKKGYGLGSSILGVLYDLPIIISLIISFLMGFFITKFELIVKSSRLLMLSAYYIVYAVTSSTRYEPFQLFYDLVLVWIVFMIIEMFYSKSLVSAK